VVAPPEGVAACDIAVPIGPHGSSAIDKMETARLATKSEESLIAMSSQMRGQLKLHPGTRISCSDASSATANFKFGH